MLLGDSHWIPWVPHNFLMISLWSPHFSSFKRSVQILKRGAPSLGGGEVIFSCPITKAPMPSSVGSVFGENMGNIWLTGWWTWGFAISFSEHNPFQWSKLFNDCRGSGFHLLIFPPGTAQVIDVWWLKHQALLVGRLETSWKNLFNFAFPPWLFVKLPNLDGLDDLHCGTAHFSSAHIFFQAKTRSFFLLVSFTYNRSYNRSSSINGIIWNDCWLASPFRVDIPSLSPHKTSLISRIPPCFAGHSTHRAAQRGQGGILALDGEEIHLFTLIWGFS